MNAKLFYWTVCLVGIPFFITGVPYGTSRTAIENLSQSIQQAKTKMMDLKYEVHNHEEEIRILKEKFNTQDTSIEQLREQLVNELEDQKQQLQTYTQTSDNKLDLLNQTQKNLETLMRGILSDLQQIKNQANDSVTTLGHYKQKINELDHALTNQAQQIQSLETAMHSIVDAMQIKDSSKDIAKNFNKPQTYKVQSGDSLEKIARLHHLSVQALQEANHMTTDRIIIGQTLKIP